MQLLRIIVFPFLFLGAYLAAGQSQDSLAVPTELTAGKQVITCEVEIAGVCKMCKERIENAALVKGVKLAEWNKETGGLKLIYRSDRVVLDSILVGVARAGHDTPRFKAPEEAYQKLPDCCAYREGVKKH